MPTIEDLGRHVKTKFPGAYDDIPDAELGAMSKDKYPGAYDMFVGKASSALGKIESSMPTDTRTDAEQSHDLAGAGLKGAASLITPQWTGLDPIKRPIQALSNPKEFAQQEVEKYKPLITALQHWGHMTKEEQDTVAQTAGQLVGTAILGKILGDPDIRTSAKTAVIKASKAAKTYAPVIPKAMEGAAKATTHPAVYRASKLAAGAGGIIGEITHPGYKGAAIGAAIGGGTVEVPAALYGALKEGSKAFKEIRAANKVVPENKIIGNPKWRDSPANDTGVTPTGPIPKPQLPSGRKVGGPKPTEGTDIPETVKKFKKLQAKLREGQTSRPQGLGEVKPTRVGPRQAPQNRPVDSPNTSTLDPRNKGPVAKPNPSNPSSFNIEGGTRPGTVVEEGESPETTKESEQSKTSQGVPESNPPDVKGPAPYVKNVETKAQNAADFLKANKMGWDNYAGLSDTEKRVFWDEVHYKKTGKKNTSKIPAGTDVEVEKRLKWLLR